MDTIIDIPSISSEIPSAGDNHPDAIPKVAVMSIMFGSAGVLDFPIALQQPPPPNGSFRVSVLLHKAYCILMFLVFVTGLLMLLLSFLPPGAGGRNNFVRSLRKKLLWVAFATAPLALGIGLYLILHTAGTTTTA